MASTFAHCNELFGAMKHGELFVHLSEPKSLKKNSAASRRLTEPCQCDAELEFRVTYNACDVVENAEIIICSRTGLRLASNSELASFASASSYGLCSKWILSIWQERV